MTAHSNRPLHVTGFTVAALLSLSLAAGFFAGHAHGSEPESAHGGDVSINAAEIAETRRLGPPSYSPYPNRPLPAGPSTPASSTRFRPKPHCASRAASR